VSARRGQRWATVKPCGTEAAYRRHLRHGEVPCEPCRLEANRVADAWRKNRTADLRAGLPR
jgi:hypothetical protein